MNIAVIFAGGSGTRMKSRDKPKQFLNIFHKPIIIHTLEHFQECEDIDAIVIACKEDWIEYLKDLIYRYRVDKVKKIVPGGSTGQLSIYQGLCAAKELSFDEDTIVLIHDGVRPMIGKELITKNVRCVQEHGSCITSGLVTETIVVVDDNLEIQHVPSRAHSRVAKAPQSFYLKDILSAHEKALNEGVTTSIDSCTLMKQYGYKLTMIDGPSENIKVTTPDDFFMMRSILEIKENEQIYLE